jgi:hypothetical protein
MRLDAGRDPALAGLDAGAQFLDVSGARVIRLLSHGGRT